MFDKNKIKRGVKVRVRSMDEVYEGIVQYWNPNTIELTIAPVYCLRLRRYIAESYNFYKSDKIDSIDVLEEPEPEVEPEQELSNTSMSEEKSSFTASLDNESNNYSPSITNHTVNKSQKSTILDSIKTYPHLLILDSCSAITVLKLIIENRFKEIGLKIYGELTRRGYISLLCIQADKYVYLIDFLSIKNEEDQSENEIIELLNDILSDSSIVKVMHNCTFASDILFHKYHITLKNVFDVKVAYNKVYNETYGKTAINSSDIELLIKQSLPNVEESHLKEDYKKLDWLKRPISSANKYVALRETAYLLELYNALYHKMLEKFTKGCDLLLTIVKNSQNEEKNRSFYQNDDLLDKELQVLLTNKKEVEVERKQNRGFSLKHNNMESDFKRRIDGLFLTSTDVEETDEDQVTLQNTKTETGTNENSFQNKYLNNDENNNNISSLFTRPVESREFARKYNLIPAGMLKITSPKSKK